MCLINKQLRKAAVLCLTSLWLVSCANTKISQSWVEPDHKQAYNDLLIIGIAVSEQNRRAYESYFVEELKDRGIEAVASYTLIKSNEKIERDTVLKAIEGMDIDGVIVTHMVAVEEETVYRSTGSYTYGGYGGYGRGYGGGYYGGLYSYYPHVNSYVHNPGYYDTLETYTLETNLYDIKSEELVWSARTRTFAPESVDAVIVDLTKLLINDLADKNLVRKK